MSINSKYKETLFDYKDQELFFGEEAVDVLVMGVNQVADMVTATIGPGGNTIVLESPIGEPNITKDGVTVAKNVKPRSPFHMGANLIKNASKDIADKYGDGTTTVTLLTQELIKIFRREKDSFMVNSAVMLKYVEQYKVKLQEFLSKEQMDIEQIDVRELVMTSTNSDKELTDMILEAYGKVGQGGLILVEESKTNSTTLKPSLGYMWDKGYVSNSFVKDKASDSIRLENPKYLVMDWKLDRFEHIKPVLLKIAEKKESLVIIANEYDPQVLSQLLNNYAAGLLNVVPINSPSFGEMRTRNMEDIAAATGSTLIGPSTNLNPWELRYEDLGESGSCLIKSDSFTVIDAMVDQEQIDTQLSGIENILSIVNLSTWEKDQHEKRKARLQAKTITICVGGYSDLEVKEKKDRYDDAIKALQVAIDGGVVAGGGIALFRASEKLEKLSDSTKDPNKRKAAEIVAELALAPIRKILENAGIEEKEVLTNLYGKQKTYTIVDGKVKYTTKNIAGCYDPYLVTNSALDVSVSLAKQLLSSKGLVLTPYKMNMDTPEMEDFSNNLGF